MAKRAREFVLVYLKGSQLPKEQEDFLEGLGKPYTCRNAQFFNPKNPETKFKEVYNFAEDKYVAEAYGDKIVDHKPKAKPAPTPKEEALVEEAPKPRGRPKKAE